MSGLPSADSAGVALGALRLAVGGTFFAAPATSLRLMGMDTATAGRVTWLARMTAARDAAVGAGTLATVSRGRSGSGWLLAGAFCDAVDAAVLAAALRARKAGGFGAVAMVGAAAASAGVGMWAAAATRRPCRG
ncbi:MAG: peptide-methionine (R)-S-oxide reductase [Pseudonocardiales bacterium]|jgi:hypothetical protein|nr:peptide-methionine (R)-S-oxide reductase [Pseudonocardiales bacterium]MDT4944893.1 peptide-methionine (R)-S-oxide reductase [Pseudonocardiales bacterium]